MRMQQAQVLFASLAVAAPAFAEAPAPCAPVSPLPATAPGIDDKRYVQGDDVACIPKDRGWIGVGGRNAVGLSPIDPDFGAYAYGGTWLLDEHVQPFARAGWSRGWSGKGSSELLVDTARLGAGLLLGTALAGDHLWIGGGAGVEGIVAFAHGGVPSSTSAGVSFPIVGVVQGARRRASGSCSGSTWDLSSCRPCSFAGGAGGIEWGAVRFNAGLMLGVILGRAVGPAK